MYFLLKKNIGEEEENLKIYRKKIKNKHTFAENVSLQSAQ